VSGKKHFSVNDGGGNDLKKIGILNKDISEVVAGMGHYQCVIVCDAGFPIPDGVRRIDLSLTPGIPAFLDVLRTILEELCVEEVIIAEETTVFSPGRYEEMTALFPNTPHRLVSHTDFKNISKTVTACIRSGECTPYSNIMLVAGVTY
jgi:D-ribose pyranase